MRATPETSEAELGTAELLWGRREPPARGPRPGLSVPAIAEAAARIADQEGYPALSMQRVAAEVGVTKMALYRYVAGKGELDAVMIELSVDEPPDLSGVPGGWRPRVERFVRELGEVWRRHPWLPWATVGDRVMGPREVGWVECAFAAFDGAGLTADERRQAVFVLFGHVRNTQSPATAGTQPWSGGAGPSAVLREVLDRHADRFPVLAALPPPAGPDDDLGRAFGLRCLLDGIETLVAGRAAAAR